MSADGAALEDRIVRADKSYRNKVLLLYALIGLTGAIAIRFLVPLGLRHLGSLGYYDLLVTLRAFFIVLLLSFTPAAVYVILVGRRILRAGRFPYEGRKVMFDTRLLTGRAARARGKALVTLGVVFVVLMLITVVYTYVRYTIWLNKPLFKRFLFHQTAVVSTLGRRA